MFLVTESLFQPFHSMLTHITATDTKKQMAWETSSKILFTNTGAGLGLLSLAQSAELLSEDTDHCSSHLGFGTGCLVTSHKHVDLSVLILPHMPGIKPIS